jgi:hypothetical protein
MAIFVQLIQSESTTFNLPSFSISLSMPINLINFENILNSFFFRFVHLGKLVTPLSCTELADLAVAADHFLVGNLINYCGSELESKMTAEEVWPVLDRVLKVDLQKAANSCLEVLLFFHVFVYFLSNRFSENLILFI